MAKPVRYQQCGCFHFLTFSCYRRLALLTREGAYGVFEHELDAVRRRYMHRNPVARGLVEKPADWPWSSFRHYATGQLGVVEIESHWTAFRRGNQLPEHLRYNQKGG